MTGFKPILCIEFGYRYCSRTDIAGGLNEMGIKPVNNLYEDPYLYYSHKYPEFDTSHCSKPMFIAQCMMNEFFEGKEINLLKIETIIEGGFAIDEGSGEGEFESTGIRVYYQFF